MSNVSDLLIRAVALHKAGQVAAAESAYRDILAEAPRHPDALNLLGMLLSGRGEYPEALALLRESLRVRPAHPGTSHNLANALQAAGDLSGAIDQHRQTLRMAPDHPGALYSLGHALLQTGDSGAAVEVLRRSVAVSPGHAAPHVALGAALSESGDAVSAVEAYRRALEIEPDRPGVLNDLGNTLRASGAIDAAIAAYRDALRLAPDEAGYHHNLALALRDGARLQEAIDAFTRALELQPDRVDTRGDLARLLEITNRVAEARDMTVEGLGHAPGDLLLNLVAAKCERRAGALDDAAGRLERMLDQTLPASWEVQFRFELGRVEDARKRSTEAFQAFRRGNALMLDEWQRENGESNAFFDYVQRQEERLAGPWSNGWAPVRVADGRRDPVFLVGFPRSGTTLLDQILDSHPEILVLEERPTIDRIEEELWDEDPGLLETLPDWNGALIERLRRRYFEVVDALGNGPHPGVLVDKMPLNSAKAALICRLFPQARFIFAVRHPRDVVLSCFMQSFDPTPAMANFYTLEDGARLYAAVMRVWERACRVLDPARHRIRYEDLLEDFDREVGALLEFLDLPWTDGLREFHAHARRRQRINTPSYHQVSQPLYTAARFRWERYAGYFSGSAELLAPFEKAFGYSSSNSAANAGTSERNSR